MAVQVYNDFLDAGVHRGEPLVASLRELNEPRQRRGGTNSRAMAVGITVGLHAAVAIALMRMSFAQQSPQASEPIEVALIDEAPAQEAPPPDYAPPPMQIVYTLPTPREISIETVEPVINGTAITTSEPVTTVAPLVESVEYVRTEPPVYPRESQRKREHGTVLLRVLVDSFGKPAQIQVERSSGFARLDAAAREAVEKFLFRPYEVNGVAQPAQVLIPIGFDRRSS